MVQSVPQLLPALKELEAPVIASPMEDPIAKAELEYILKLKEAPLENLFAPEIQNEIHTIQNTEPEPAEAVLRENRYKVPEAFSDVHGKFQIRREDIVWMPKETE